VNEPCAIQSGLSEAVEEATQRMNSAGAERYAAMKEDRNAGPYAVELAAARADYSQAIKKLKAHKKSHGCDPQPRKKKI
jgi:hypothetical protein